MKRRPTFEEYHRLGEKVSKELESCCSFTQIGRAIGVNKQRARYIGMVALGKLAHGLRQVLKES